MTTALVPLTAAGPLSRQWFTVASSQALEEAPIAVRLLGNDLVLWRSPSGTVVAAPDRCTHSKRALSKGTVDDGRLVCAKHGWTFGDEGRCVLKPSGLPITDKAHLKIHPCVERNGLIWVSYDDPAEQVVEPIWDADERFRRVHTEVSVWRSNPIQVIETLLAASDSLAGDVTADLPFVVNAMFRSDDSAEHHRLLSCAPVDGRASIVTTMVWTTSTVAEDDRKIVDETLADLAEVKSVAEAMAAAPLAAGQTPDNEESMSSDWKRRLLAYLGNGE